MNPSAVLSFSPSFAETSCVRFDVLTCACPLCPICGTGCALAVGVLTLATSGMLQDSLSPATRIVVTALLFAAHVSFALALLAAIARLLVAKGQGAVARVDGCCSGCGGGWQRCRARCCWRRCGLGGDAFVIDVEDGAAIAGVPAAGSYELLPPPPPADD